MRLPTSLPVSLAIVGLVSGPALAAELAVSIEIPRLTVAEYHRPYVAIWLEGKSPRPGRCRIAATRSRRCRGTAGSSFWCAGCATPTGGLGWVPAG